MIEFLNVSKNYGAFTALDDVSFRIQPGEIVGLVGANGAGKTTTMKLLNRYLTPDAGTIFMDNADIFAEKNALPMAYIPDAPIYYEFLTVKEHFQFIRDMYPMGEYAVDELVKRFGLQQYLQKMPHALSKGNQQKLMIAMALLRNFSYLIADEPFNGLDPKHMHVLKAIFFHDFTRFLLLLCHDTICASSCLDAPGCCDGAGTGLCVRRPGGLAGCRLAAGRGTPQRGGGRQLALCRPGRGAGGAQCGVVAGQAHREGQGEAELEENIPQAAPLGQAGNLAARCPGQLCLVGARHGRRGPRALCVLARPGLAHPVLAPPACDVPRESGQAPGAHR